MSEIPFLVRDKKVFTHAEAPYAISEPSEKMTSNITTG